MLQVPMWFEKTALRDYDVYVGVVKIGEIRGHRSAEHPGAIAWTIEIFQLGSETVFDTEHPILIMVAARLMVIGG